MHLYFFTQMKHIVFIYQIIKEIYSNNTQSVSLILNDISDSRIT